MIAKTEFQQYKKSMKKVGRLSDEYDRIKKVEEYAPHNKANAEKLNRWLEWIEAFESVYCKEGFMRTDVYCKIYALRVIDDYL